MGERGDVMSKEYAVPLLLIALVWAYFNELADINRHSGWVITLVLLALSVAVMIFIFKGRN